MSLNQPTTELMHDGLGGSLEHLGKMIGAAGIRLITWSGQGCCTDSQTTEEAGSNVVLGTVQAECQHFSQDNAQLLAAAWPRPNDPISTTMCAHCRLDTGEAVGLQLAFPDSTGPTSVSRSDLAALAVPVLMWVKHHLECQRLAAHQAQVEEQYRADLLLAIEAQEEEREWLALEVHDRVAQTLASVFQQLQTLETLAGSSKEMRQVAVRGSVLCREAIREARSIMNDLHPPVLEELGLIPVMREELDRLEKDAGCHTRRKLASSVRAPRDVEITLYRIFHEALINIRRHSNAGQVTVTLELGQDDVQLKIEDNGIGFDVHEALAKKRVGGLVSMQRRAELAGGNCHLESRQETGTRVSAWLPYNREASRNGQGGLDNER